MYSSHSRAQREEGVVNGQPVLARGVLEYARSGRSVSVTSTEISTERENSNDSKAIQRLPMSHYGATPIPD